MFKYYNGNIPTPVSDLVTINAPIHTHNTRQEKTIANREYMYRNFNFVGVYVWNHITSTFFSILYHHTHPFNIT